MTRDERIKIIGERLQYDIPWLFSELAWERRCYQSLCKVHEGTMDTVRQLDARVKELELVLSTITEAAEDLGEDLNGIWVADTGRTVLGVE